MTQPEKSTGTTSYKTGFTWLTASSVIFMVSGYIIHFWLGRLLGPEAYGMYGVIIALMTILNLIQTSGIPQAVSKNISEDETRASAVLTSGLVIQVSVSLVLTVLLYMSANTIAGLLNDPSLSGLIRAASFILPSYAVYSIYIGYYNGLHKFRKQAVMNSIYSVAKVVAVIGLVYPFRLYGAVYGFVVAPLTAILFGFRLPGVSGYPYRKLILFSLPLIGFAITSNMQQSIDLFFTKSLLQGSDATGFYTAGQNIARIPFFALSALSVILFPGVSKSISNKRSTQTKLLITTSLRYVLIILLPGVLLLSATGSTLVTLLYSEAYLPAGPSLSVLAIAFGGFTIFTVLANILNGAALPHLSLLFSAVGLGVTIILCYILIPVYGLLGASLATTAGSLTSLLFAVEAVYRRFGAFIPGQNFARIITASGAVYAIARVSQAPPIVLPFLYVALGMLYIAILYCIGELTPGDWSQIRTILPFRRKHA